MKGLMAALTSAVAVGAVAAATAVAGVPNGNGFISFGTFNCGSLGSVEIVGPRPEQAPTGWTTTGVHLVAVSISGTFTDLEGNTFSFSKSYGAKAGLASFTCTAHFEDSNQGSGDETVVVVAVPPT
jgi:hypothetical protein